MLAWTKTRREARRLALLYLLALWLVVQTGITGPRAVTLYMDGEPRVLHTYETRVEDIIAAAGIELKEEDRVAPARGGLLGLGEAIQIRRAYPVYLKVDGAVLNAHSAGETAAQLARRLKIHLSPYDQAVPAWKTRVAPGQVLEILRVEIHQETVTEEYEPEVVTRRDPSLAWGALRVEEEGAAGLAARVYQVTRVQGREETRELVAARWVQEPRPRVLVQGTAPRGTRVARDSLRLGDSWQGIASWYGGYFHGRKTANGEIYNMYALTAAHPFLPFGTRVLVSHVRNGKQVEVRINDRGPFIEGRIIDLSVAAAEAIDMYLSGLATIKLEILALP